MGLTLSRALSAYFLWQVRLSGRYITKYGLGAIICLLLLLSMIGANTLLLKSLPANHVGLCCEPLIIHFYLTYKLFIYKSIFKKLK